MLERKKRATWSPALVFPKMEWRVYSKDFADMCPGEAPLECRQRRCTPYSDCQRQSSCRISTDRSSAMMRVHSMAFCGKDDSYVAVDFDKESWQPRQSRAVHWRSGSLLAHLLPSLELGLQDSQTEGPEIGVCPGGHFEIMKGCKPWGRTLCWVHATETDSVEQPHVEPLVALGEYGNDDRRWLEDWCFSSDGTLLAAVMNWEDGDQREDPDLVVYNLRPFLTELEARRAARRARALLPLRTFVMSLSLCERQVAEIPSLIQELRLEEGRPGTGTTMESQPGVISDALAAVFGNASLVELIESWLLQWETSEASANDPYGWFSGSDDPCTTKTVKLGSRLTWREQHDWRSKHGQLAPRQSESQSVHEARGAPSQLAPPRPSESLPRPGCTRWPPSATWML